MENYEEFKKCFFDLSGINLDAYKEKQMRRRIETLISRKGFDSYAQYADLLRTERNELESFIDYITINVTEFFRTPDHWDFFEKNVIPRLVERAESSGKKIKIWSAGCSTGEEPYSLAMMLLKHLKESQFQIFATDIDENILEKAEKGIYTEKSMENFPGQYKEFLEKYFEKDSGLLFRLKDEVKNQVDFHKLDLTLQDFPENCDLIVCRNVLIYFTDETKQIIFNKTLESLKSGGFLFLGRSEQIVYYKNFGLEKLARNFYRKG